MEQEKKYFQGKLNADDADFAVAPDEYVNAENVRFGSTDAGVIKTTESIGSTALITNNYLPAGTNIRIGGCADVSRGTLLWFNWNSNGDHGIYSYVDGVIYKVLLDSQVTGGLNFDKDYIIHSCRVVNGILYWTDNLNPQRRINIDAGIKLNHPSYVTDQDAYTSPLAYQSITLIRKPPMLPLVTSKIYQTSPALINNFIYGNAFQFSYRYYYRDGEKSVPAIYSLLSPYNVYGDTWNRIDVVVPQGETILQDVQRVDVLVKYGNQNEFFTIKSWDKSVTSEAAEIAAHNAGTTPLTYSFYNDTLGIPESEAYSLKPFDSVPVLSETMEVFNNRLGLGNNIEGYDSPTRTSLAAAIVDETSGTDPDGKWVSVTYSGGVEYFLEVDSGSAYYKPSSQPPPFPATITYASLTLVATSPTAFITYLIPLYSGWTGGFPYTGDVSTVTGYPDPVSFQGKRCFKTGANYKLAVQFYDFADRKSGYITNGVSYEIPDRSYNSLTYVTGIAWTLDNLNADLEIPSWATHYSVCISKCLRTRYFIQARSKTSLPSSLIYVKRNSDNSYDFSTSAYDSTLAGVGIDITNLQNFGMGYAFAEGDIVNVYKNGDSNVYRLRITGQEGRWIICELKDLGSLSNTTEALFEIYTPYIASSNEPMYEVGTKYTITDAGTNTPTYSVTAGTIQGDVTLLERGTTPANYFTENMSPDDKYYQNWYTDHGRPNFIDKIGQQVKETNLSWSNTLIPGTRTNGLSTFDALDEKNLPAECGAIQKLQITSKVQNELGVVMLAICTNETASLYIGETQQYGSNQQTTLTVSTDIIGTINVLKGNFGTINPESVCELRGNVFWLDAKNGKVIQYGASGLYPISNYKMTRFWKQFSDQFMSMSTPQIEAFGGRPYVFGAVDPHHNELLFSIPKLLSTPPKGYLPDYPSTVYPFDIWDGQAKTTVYKIASNQSESENNRWQGSYTFTPEGFVTLQNKLFAFKNGNLYQHNQTSSSCNFYGVQHKARIMCLANTAPTKPKQYLNHSVEANMRPSFTYFYIEPTLSGIEQYNIHQQATDLVQDSYTVKEGQLYSLVYRNKLVPTVDGFSTNGLLTGEEMRGLTMKVMLEFDVSQYKLEFKFTSFGFALSLGHTT